MDNIFYSNDILNLNQEFVLDEQESKHCILVLRLKIGDIINVVDGVGGFYKTQIIDDNKKKCSVIVNEVVREYNKRDFYLHIAVAITKNSSRYEWFVEKATEIGVDEITPFYSKNSERNKINVERLEKVALSAMKQSKKAYLPKINEPVKLDTLIKNRTEESKFIAHCSDIKKTALKDSIIKANSVVILIGPEGDFHNNEINSAIKNNFISVDLSKSILRTETAAMVACNIINVLNS